MSPQSQPQIILASSSPYRLQILQNAGINASQVTPEFQEHHDPYIQRNPLEAAKNISLQKAESLKHLKDKLILAFDTIVVANENILNKPQNQQDAINMLNSYSGQTVKVITGVCILDTARSRRVILQEITNVKVANLSKQEIDWYISTDEWKDKSGAMSIDGLGSRFIERIEGDYQNVIGLPLRLVYEQIINMGYEDLVLPRQEMKSLDKINSPLPFL